MQCNNIQVPSTLLYLDFLSLKWKRNYDNYAYASAIVSYAALLSKVDVNNLLILFVLINYFYTRSLVHTSRDTCMWGRLAHLSHVAVSSDKGTWIQFDFVIAFPSFTLGNGGNPLQRFMKNLMQYRKLQCVPEEVEEFAKRSLYKQRQNKVSFVKRRKTHPEHLGGTFCNYSEPPRVYNETNSPHVRHKSWYISFSSFTKLKCNPK